MTSNEEWIKDLQQRLNERKREEREEREQQERDGQEQDQRLPPAGDRPRLETLANPRPSPSQPAADTAPGSTQAGGGLDRDDPFGEVTGGAAAMRPHVAAPVGGGGTSEREATSISFEGGAATTTGTSAGVAQTSTNTDNSADTDVDGGDHADLDDAAHTMVSATADATAGVPENARPWDESDDRKVEFG